LSFRFVTGDEQGNVYAVTDHGDLLFYRDTTRNGTGSWADGGMGRRIGKGWEEYVDVFSGGDGVLYAVKENGDLLYYRDLARNGQAQWAFHGVGQKIGTGFASFARLLSGGDGIIYAVALNGDLYFFRDEARNGTSRWAHHGVGQKIGTGWGDFRHIVSGGDGVLYAVPADGTLLFYRDEARDGTRRWAFNGVGQQIGHGWRYFPALISGGGGVIYALTPDGFVLFYRDRARNGRSSWASGSGKEVGAGWYVTPQTTTVEGYPLPLSVAPGDTVDFKMSATKRYTVTYLRLKQQPDGSVGIPLTDAFAVDAGVQSAPDEAWDFGCGWRTTFGLSLPVEWPSGLYAARCTDSEGKDSYVVFVVKPDPQRRADIAVLANTNTWNAYNSWGGRSKYTHTGSGPVLSLERPNPLATPIDDGHLNHTTRAELWLLGWLEDAGYRVDVYSDLDFHSGIDDLAGYKALILNTHPEYWTSAMRDHLDEYLASGGNLLYLGGNGLFERCEYIRGDSAVRFEGGDPSLGRPRNYWRNLGRPERAVLGVAFMYNNYFTQSDPAPYRVEMAGHSFFAGTGLSNGDEIGQNGRNGAASGWEMDWSENAAARDGVIVTAWEGSDRGRRPDNLQLLARGTNRKADGNPTAHMTYYDHHGGGFVFATGSLCFTGSLVQDVHLQLIVKNALDAALRGLEPSVAAATVAPAELTRAPQPPGPPRRS
jgi:N,N-dimethylformamidase